MNNAWKVRFIGLSIAALLPALASAGDSSVSPLSNKFGSMLKIDKCGNLIGINKASALKSEGKQSFPSSGDVWIYTAFRDGTLRRRVHQTSGSARDTGNKWLTMEALIEGGPGWDAFQHLFSLNGRIYAVTKAHELVWYQGEGSGKSDGFKRWAGPNAGISDRDRFRSVFPMGSYKEKPQELGVIYAIDDNGNVWWYRHQFVKVVDGCRKIDNTRWEGPQKVKSDWMKYVQVFSGGDGVIYGLDQNGVLFWQKHQDWYEGGTVWHEPRAVHPKFREATQIFGTGYGNIYAVDGQGSLFSYRHIGWDDGSDQWEDNGGVPIGAVLVRGAPKWQTVFAYIPLPSGFYP